jgi:hypothetical protein
MAQKPEIRHVKISIGCLKKQDGMSRTLIISI